MCDPGQNTVHTNHTDRSMLFFYVTSGFYACSN